MIRANSWCKLALVPTVLGAVAGACVPEKAGNVGTVEDCSTVLPAYEGTAREVVSSLTGVDTAVGIRPVAEGPGCCLAENGYGFPSDWYTAEILVAPTGPLRIPALPPNTARYPWNGHCPVGGGLCETCNLCRYGIQAAQGVWVDIPPGHTGDQWYGDVANRLSFDGNTFLWQAKNRTTGWKVEYRGYYFCAKVPVVTFVLTDVVRTTGPPCTHRYRNDSDTMSPSEPWPSASAGSALASELSGKVAYDGGGWLTLRISSYGETDQAELLYQTTRHFCHPGEAFASDAEGKLVRFCGDESEFFDCWDATEAPSPTP